MQIFDDNYSFLKENRNAELVLYSVKGGREEQQDCSGYEIADNRLMAVICDGMGGENDGKKASNTAVGEFLNQYLLSENDGKPHDFFEKAISIFRKICYNGGKQESAYQSMHGRFPDRRN